MNGTLRVAIAGHVDHGKSTVIGRLLSDTKQVRDDKFHKVQKICESSGKKFEYAFLLDALEEEQQQGITIDVTEVPWIYEGREYTIIDTPGHREFLKNMVGGASRADAAVLVVDAQEGLKIQFQRQVAVMGLLGIPRIVVVLNKMDLVGWREDIFLSREQEVQKLFQQAGLRAPLVIPAGAWLGANLIEASDKMPWFKGPTLARAMSELPAGADRLDLPLRFPLQDVYKFDDRRIYVGRVESGRLRVGDEIRFQPSGRASKIKTIEIYGEESPLLALPGEAVGITLEDPLFLERGEIGHPVFSQPRVSKTLTVDLFWLSAQPLEKGKSYGLRCANSEMNAQVEAIESVLDPETLEQSSSRDARIEAGGIGRVTLSLEKSLAHDFFKEFEATGRLVLVEDFRVCGGGRIVSDQRAFLKTEESSVSSVERRDRNGHPGFVLWTTGLSGAGKSTIARLLEEKLFSQGVNVFVLDGDNIRQGISSDLGFSDADRSENIRRVAEVAKLFAQAGVVTLTAFISPFAADRERARAIIGADRFLEVFVDCPIQECERRDPKKLYARARQGEVAQFTGLTSGYEPPSSPALRISTDRLSPQEAVDKIVDFLVERPEFLRSYFQK